MCLSITYRTCLHTLFMFIFFLLYTVVISRHCCTLVFPASSFIWMFDVVMFTACTRSLTGIFWIFPKQLTHILWKWFVETTISTNHFLKMWVSRFMSTRLEGFDGIKLRPHQTPRRAAPRRAAKFSKRGSTKSSAARENPVSLDADYAWRVFLRHMTLLAIVIGHRATPKNAAPWKINFSQLSFRGARGVKQRGAACSVAPCYDKQNSYLFLTSSTFRQVWTQSPRLSAQALCSPYSS